MNKVELGKKYKDVVTGYEGVAVARCEYLHATPRVMLRTLVGGGVDSKVVENWYYEAELELVADS